jgi:pimeloyl-ACP methyl ester carboxylesterase
MKNIKIPSMALGSLLLLAGCADGLQTRTPSSLAPARSATLLQCDALREQFKFSATRIESTALVPAGAVRTGPQPTAVTAYTVKDHCLVKGKMHERQGADGQPYAIGFEMRLPKEWNGRFFYQANGGLDGVVQPALGALGGGPLTGALAQGFAVISSDAGHGPGQNPYFGSEPQARQDYGYAAVGKLTPMAKALINTAYGKSPDRSYIAGCSNGGRHTLVAASRYAEQFDGYLAGAPGYRLPNAALAQLWGSSKWNSLAPAGPTVNHPFNPNLKFPDIGAGFNADDRQILARAILAKCDALDGANDGLVQDVSACQKAFNVQSDVPSCNAGRDGKCLSALQKNVIDQVFKGGQTASGTPYYSSFPFDTGVSGNNWATWKFVFSQALDPGALSHVFTSPKRDVKAFDTDYDNLYAGIFAKPPGFSESADDTITPLNHAKPTNMKNVQQRGAKVMLYHGVSDPVFSETDTRAWVDRVAKEVPNSANFVRHFPIPGMNHCSAGPATDQFDALTPLVAWVEQGIAPDSITAQARGAGNAGGVNTELPASWSAQRTRPLCAYPKVAKYTGSGSLENAANFSCQ